MTRALILLPAALLLMPAIAQAQLGSGPAGGVVPAERRAAPQLAPAPALPGVPGRRAPAAIEADPNANLSPNAALFDAINRGDLAGVREAVSRGADLNARNQLGLTPLDASVDQGRNEISFFLLSARPAGGTAEPVSRPGILLNRPPANSARREATGGEAQPGSGSAALAAQAALTAGRGARVPATPVAVPRLWAGDGGTPQPEIGFLGFDAGRPPGAVPPVQEDQPARRRGRG
jgi:hypothetical protein